MKCSKFNNHLNFLVNRLFLNGFTVCQSYERLIGKDPIITAVIGINDVTTHPSDSSSVVAVTVKTVFTIDSAGVCIALLGKQYDIPTSCTRHAEYMLGNTIQPTFLMNINVLSVASLGLNTVLITDRDRGCVRRLEINSPPSITHDGWIGVCSGLNYAQALPQPFNKVELISPHSTVYDPVSDCVLLISRDFNIIKCDIQKATCYDITEGHLQLRSLTVVSSDVIQFSSNPCSYILLGNTERSSSPLIQQPSMCSTVNLFTANSVLYAVVDINDSLVIYSADFSDGSSISFTKAQPYSYPSANSSIHQGGVNEIYSITKVASSSNITRLVTEETPAAVSERVVPVRFQRCTACESQSRITVASTGRIQTCAYICARNTLCAFFAYNSVDSKCTTFKASTGVHGFVEAAGKCYCVGGIIANLRSFHD